MKIIRNLAVILLVMALISNRNQEADLLQAQAAESTAHICDHSACRAEIAILEAELASAQERRELILRIEIEIVPGLLGDWAQLEFRSIPLMISAEAAENLSPGDNLCRAAGDEWNIIECRIIVDSLLPA